MSSAKFQILHFPEKKGEIINININIKRLNMDHCRVLLTIFTQSLNVEPIFSLCIRFVRQHRSNFTRNLLNP